MYRRLIILSGIIVAALCGLSWLGYRAIEIRAQGLEGARLGEFAEVAEQIRQDVKRKLDEFIQREQQRPYTDYQYYYVPENVVAGQQQMPLLRSPLGDQLENDFAYGNFQIEPDGSIVNPYYREEQSLGGQQDELAREVNVYLDNIRRNVLPALGGTNGAFRPPFRAFVQADAKSTLKKLKVAKEQQSKGKPGRAKQYAIGSLQKDSQKEQIITQQRSVVASNVAQIAEPRQQAVASSGTQRAQRERGAQLNELAGMVSAENNHVQEASRQTQSVQMLQAPQPHDRQQPFAEGQAETVQIRIEPFVPLVVPGEEAEQSIFGGQVFLLRHVQIENKHLLQGFQLNEKKLIEEVKESAQRFMRKGMSFELPRVGDGQPNGDIAYTAILDFGFGDLVLNLKEIDPAWIVKQINQLRNWYFSIIAIVLLAVTLGLTSLWRNVQAQIKLAQKKDDFISAVSHELRTPLTSIRMYSEMLEKNWVKSKDKLTEYYRNMRAEGERLSRLIENVLDFSRIQRGRKKYTFSAGDMNKSIAEIVEMMRPYAAENGFSIKTDFGQLGQTSFDRDAVTQIVVNLLDNAVKYAREAEDKTITVRTRADGQYIIIEVEDHGPGVPHRQRKKIFEEFYRIEAEATRETTGTGLGLALVRKFAQAHNGFVEIAGAEPTGVIFRVALTARR